MRKIIPIFVVLLLFAIPASAGQVQIVDHDIEWLSSCSDYAHYHWHANIQNCATCPNKINLKISLYDENGYVLDTVYQSVYLQGRQRQSIDGSANLNCNASQVKTSAAEIMNVRHISR